jgi:hypothetical protein
MNERELLAAREQIKFLRESRERGNLAKVEESTIQELMCSLIPLARSNATADTLENMCVAAIFAYQAKEYDDYARYLKRIIEIGDSL